MDKQLGFFTDNKPPTQTDKVLGMLKENDLGVCATTFNREYIPRFSARILELRKQGHEIEKRKCFQTSHNHHTKQVRYILMPPRKHRLSPSE